MRGAGTAVDGQRTGLIPSHFFGCCFGSHISSRKAEDIHPLPLDPFTPVLLSVHRSSHKVSLLHRLARRSHSWSRVTSSSVKQTFQGIPLESWCPVSLPPFSHL